MFHVKTAYTTALLVRALFVAYHTVLRPLVRYRDTSHIVQITIYIVHIMQIILIIHIIHIIQIIQIMQIMQIIQIIQTIQTTI